MGDYEQLRAEGDQLEKKIIAARKACADTNLKTATSSIEPICESCGTICSTPFPCLTILLLTRAAVP